MDILDRSKKFYRLFNILSIDVALGSICCALWFARIFEVELKPQALIVLGLTVWIIYTIDHLLDARKTDGIASTERHRFHQHHSTILWLALGVVTAINLTFLIFIRKPIFQWGMALSAVMIAYFLMQRFLKYLKEFTIAVIFSCGVLLPSLALTQKPIDFSSALVVSGFMLTALLNLLLFSWFDRHSDIQDKRESFVTLAGEKRSKKILEIIFAINFMLLLSSALFIPTVVDKVAVLLLMNGILIFMFVRPAHFQAEDRFRLIGDGIFLLPILYLFL